MAITRQDYGKVPDGTAVDLYVMTNGTLTVKVITYGAIITEIHAPDRDGNPADIVLGFDSLQGYLARHPYFGAVVGRVANRVAGGKFSLDGRDYTLATNNGPNALHGGLVGFDRAVWKAEVLSQGDEPSLRLSHLSPDGDEGYPGNLSVRVTYTLTRDNALRIDYEATADAPTPINLTNHSYFNLGGAGSGSILGHVLRLHADRYTPVDDTLIPTGEILPVAGTPMNFTDPAEVGSRIDSVGGDPGGYDHNFVVNGQAGQLRPAATIRDPHSGRVLEASTTEPGIQFYSGNFLDGQFLGKSGAAYGKREGFCLEAQHFPDSINQPDFPSTVLRPGETYTQTTVYQFSAE